MKVNKYFPFAFIYFFVNSVALPFGLTYTAILAPLFYLWIVTERKKDILLPFIAILAPFILAQVIYVDVVRKVYFYSLFNVFLVYIFCQAVYTFLIKCQDPDSIFKKLLVINFILCIIGIGFYFSPWYHYMWLEQDLTKGVSDFRRLKLFTYEPSYYATVFVPLFCFYLLQYFFRQNKTRGWILLPMLFLPLVLSLSFGVIAALFLSAIIMFLFHFRTLIYRKRIFNGLIAGSFLVLAATAIIFFFFRDSFLVIRLSNIISGVDTSGKGRTFDAYLLAHELIGQKNEFWGIGLGQVKILGEDVIRNFYLYGNDFVATIPNAVAETLTIFGWIGLALRFAIELFFFFHTKVWTNYLRLWLFVFMFLFQFTGSFITNVAEYVIWIMAFTNLFHQFNVPQEKKLTHTALATGV